jgi:hypothetical protein
MRHAYGNANGDTNSDVHSVGNPDTVSDVHAGRTDNNTFRLE